MIERWESESFKLKNPPKYRINKTWDSISKGGIFGLNHWFYLFLIVLWPKRLIQKVRPTLKAYWLFFLYVSRAGTCEWKHLFFFCQITCTNMTGRAFLVNFYKTFEQTFQWCFSLLKKKAVITYTNQNKVIRKIARHFFHW